MKQKFEIEITTDGMDGPSDMRGVAKDLEAMVASIVRPYVREIAPARVTWVVPKRKGKTDARR